MKKVAINFILVLFLVCFMAGGVYALGNDLGSSASNGAIQVPEPASLLMLGSGLVGVFALVRKFKKK